MPQTDSKTVAAQLKKGQLYNLYYLYGADVTGVEKLTKAIIRAAVGDNEDFSLTKLEGRKLDSSELYDIMQLVPMMSEYNCILINDYNCEKPLETMQGRSAEDLNKKLINTLKEVPPQTVIIFNVTGFEVKLKYDWKSRKNVIADKNKKLADYIAKNGICCESGVKTPEELAKEISAKVSARGGIISLENAKALSEMCLSDTLTIENEIDKLCAYTQGKEITAEILDMLVHRQSDMTVYRLAGAVAAMDRKAAFEAIDEMNVDKDNRPVVMAAITGTFLDLYRAACARQSGVSQESVVNDFGYGAGRAFVVKNAFRDCSGMSVSRLRECIRILRDTAVKFNSSASDPKIMLEQAVSRMLMTKNQRR